MTTWLLGLATYLAWCEIWLRSLQNDPGWQRVANEIFWTLACLGFAIAVTVILCARLLWRLWLSCRRRGAAAPTATSKA